MDGVRDVRGGACASPEFGAAHRHRHRAAVRHRAAAHYQLSAAPRLPHPPPATPAPPASGSAFATRTTSDSDRRLAKPATRAARMRANWSRSMPGAAVSNEAVRSPSAPPPPPPPSPPSSDLARSRDSDGSRVRLVVAVAVWRWVMQAARRRCCCQTRYYLDCWRSAAHAASRPSPRCRTAATHRAAACR